MMHTPRCMDASASFVTVLAPAATDRAEIDAGLSEIVWPMAAGALLISCEAPCRLRFRQLGVGYGPPLHLPPGNHRVLMSDPAVSFEYASTGNASIRYENTPRIEAAFPGKGGCT